ncbi:MAG: OsmC family protein [Candidatus Glassbacteria bacterium]|nr:OsmC family protein [Candidatus Glassbacteria bacterium]
MAIAKARWVEGLQFAATSGSNHAIMLDGSEKGGGLDSAVHPGELILLGLASCTGMDVISLLKKMRVEVDQFEVRVEAEAAEEHPKAWRKIHLTYFVVGRDIPEDKLEKAIRLSQDKYCGVTATLRQAVEIAYDHEIQLRD